MAVRTLTLVTLGATIAFSPPLRRESESRREVESMKRDIDALRASLAELRRRHDELSAGATAVNKVRAPFEVVDAGGKVLFRVFQASHKGGVATVLNGSKEVAWMSALAEGGMFKTRSAATYPELVMGSVGAYGALLIRDGADETRAGLALENGKPVLSLRNDNHTPIAVVTQGSSGGGLIELGDAAGHAQLRAGITAGGCGRVETYPERPVRATALGVPGDKILGYCP